MGMGLTALCLANGPGEARRGAEPRPPVKELPSLVVSPPTFPKPAALLPDLRIPGMVAAHGCLREWADSTSWRGAWAWPWVPPTTPTLMEA